MMENTLEFSLDSSVDIDQYDWSTQITNYSDLTFNNSTAKKFSKKNVTNFSFKSPKADKNKIEKSNKKETTKKQIIPEVVGKKKCKQKLNIIKFHEDSIKNRLRARNTSTINRLSNSNSSIDLPVIEHANPEVKPQRKRKCQNSQSGDSIQDFFSHEIFKGGAALPNKTAQISKKKKRKMILKKNKMTKNTESILENGSIDKSIINNYYIDLHKPIDKINADKSIINENMPSKLPPKNSSSIDFQHISNRSPADNSSVIPETGEVIEKSISNEFIENRNQSNIIDSILINKSQSSKRSFQSNKTFVLRNSIPNENPEIPSKLSHTNSAFSEMQSISLNENSSKTNDIINNSHPLINLDSERSILSEIPPKFPPINSSSIDIQHLSNRSLVDNNSVIPETGEVFEKSISNEFIENLNQSNIIDSVLINKSQTSIRYLESDKTFVLSNAEDGQNIADKSIFTEYREMPSKLPPKNSSSIDDIQHLSNRSPVDNNSVIPETGEVIEKSISNEFIENRNQSNFIDSVLINKSQSSNRSFQSNKTFVLRNSDEGQNVADKSILNENPEITYKLSRENSTFREMQSISLNENPSKINDIINNSHPLINLDSERSILSEIPEIISILSPINSSGIEIETLSEQSPVENSLLFPEKSISNEFIEYRNQSNIIDSVLINKSQTSIRYSESDKTFVLSNAEDGQNISDKSIINENSKMSSKLSQKNLSNKSQVDNSSVFPEKSISNEFIENLNQSDIIDSVLINNSQTSIRYLESDKTFVLSNAEDKIIADQSIINEISEIPSNLSSIDSSSVEIQALSEFIENRNQSNIDGSVIINKFQLLMECSGSNTNEPGLANHNIANKSIINENQSNLSSIDSSGIEILALTEQSQVDNSSVIPEKPISNRFIENQNQSNIDRSILINKLLLPIECLGSNTDESGLENHNIANKSIINEYPEMNLNENDNSHLLINTDSERFSKIPEMSSKSFPMINSSRRYIDSSRQLLMSNSSKKFNREDFSIEFNENLNQSNVSNSPIVNVLQRPMECLESCKLSNPNASGLKHQNNSNKSVLNNKGGESPRHNVMISANESIGCEQRFSDTNSFREIELPQNWVLTNNSLNMSQTNENVRMECLEKSENELYHSIVDENNSIEPEIPSTLNNENNLLMPLSISKSPNNVIIIGNSALKNSTFSSRISTQEQIVEKSFPNRFDRKETGTCSKVYDDIEMSNVLDNQKSVINNNSLLPNLKKSILKENQMVQDNLMTPSLNSELQISPNQSISLVNKSVINNNSLLPNPKKSILKENQMVKDNLMTPSLNSELQISPNQSISLVNKSVINNLLPNPKKSILKENQMVQDNLMTPSLNSELQISPNQSISLVNKSVINNLLPNPKKSILQENQMVQDNLMTPSLNSELQISPNQSISLVNKSVINNNSLLPNPKKSILKENQMVKDNLMTPSLNSELQISPNQSISLVNKSVINNLLPNPKKSILKENQMVQDNLMTPSLNSELQISPNQSISLVNKSVINNLLPNPKKSILQENQMVQDNLMTPSLNSELQISPNQSISLVNKSVINNNSLLPNPKKSILQENQMVKDNLMTPSLNSEFQISPNQSISLIDKSVINNLLPNPKKSILKENQMVKDNLMTPSLNSELQISPNQSISLVNKSVINNLLPNPKKSILKENQMVQDNLMTPSLNSELQISPNQSISLVNKSVINNNSLLPNPKKSILQENQMVPDNLMTPSLNSELQISPNQSIEPNHTQIIDNEVGESVNAEKNVTATGKTDKVDICLEREVNSNVDKMEISAKHIENIPPSEIEFRNSFCEEIKDGKETARNPMQTDNNISNGIINEPNKDLLDVETVNENSKPMENIMDKIHSSTDMSFLKDLAVQSLSRIISLETGETDIQHSPYIDLVGEKLHEILSTIVTSRQNDIESRKGKNNGTQTDKIVRKRSVKIQCELSDYEETADMDLKTIWIRKAMDFKGDEMKSSIKDVEGEIIPRQTKVPLGCDNDVESSQAISRINLPPSHSKIAKSQQPGNDIEIPNIIDSDKHLSIRNTNELESNFKVSYFESTRVIGGNNQKLQVNLSSIDNVATSSAQTTVNPTNGNFSEYESIVDSENENIDSFSGGGKLPSAVKHLPHDKNQYSVIPEEVDEISGMKQSDNLDENVSIPTDKQSINPVVKRTRNYKIDLNDISSIKRDPGNPFNFIDFSLSVIKPVLRNTARSFQSVNDPIILDPGVIDRGHGKRKVIKPISHPKEVIIRRKDGNVIRMMPPSPDTVSRRRKAKNHQDNEHKFQNYLRPLDGISILTNESIRTKVVFFSKEICFEGAIKSKPTKIQFRTLTRTKTNTKTDAMFRCPFKNVYIIINQYKFLFEPDKIFLVPKAVPFMFYNRSELAVTITETCPSLTQ